ncbi:MAG: hypothetical protein ABF743_09830 [Schleiferilactobacillus perolens]|uniref:hypothetical protein n=1 Tax=Schleiferilactobacillus perolens TaxID=100468 RepID=UPI0039EA6D5F
MMPTFLVQLFQKRHVRPITMYHILRGKRTFSNLYAAFINDLLPYWGLLPHLERAAYEKEIQSLIRRNQLVADPDGYLTVTDTTEIDQSPMWWPRHVAGLVMPPYRESGDLLTLAVQLLSQLSQHDPHFAPVTPHILIQQRVKQWYRQVAQSHLAAVTAELADLLDQLPPIQALVVVNRFMGRNLDVASWDDLAKQCHLDPFIVQLMWVDGIAQFYTLCQQPQNQYWRPLFPPPTAAVTASAQTTMQLLPGRTIRQVAAKRRLAESTIREHILEAAMLGDQVLTEIPEWGLAPVGCDHVQDFFRDRLSAIAARRMKEDIIDE